METDGILGKRENRIPRALHVQVAGRAAACLPSDCSHLWILYGDWGGDKAPPPCSPRRALALSLRVAPRDTLFPPMEAFLRGCGPVGCADRGTLKKMRASGLRSYLSGSLCRPLQERLARTACEKTRVLCVNVGFRNRGRLPRSMREVAKISLPSAPLDAGMALRNALRLARLVSTVDIVQGHTPWSGDRPSHPQLWKTVLGTALRALSMGEEAARAVERSTELNVAYCVDLVYSEPAAVSAYSLIQHNLDHDLAVYFFHRGGGFDVTTKLVRALRSSFPGVLLFAQDVKIDPLPYASHLEYVSATTNDRLLLTSLLPEVSRVVYIDGDTVILGDLRQAGLCGGAGATGIAARDSISNLMCHPAWNGGRHYEGESSFNAGVLILDLDILRERGFEAYVRTELRRKPCNDQTLLNHYCHGKHKKLPRSANIFANCDKDLGGPRCQPVVVHFLWAPKAVASRVLNLYGPRVEKGPSVLVASSGRGPSAYRNPRLVPRTSPRYHICPRPSPQPPH